ncbi:hypothetical protein [Thermovibrio sp.]
MKRRIATLVLMGVFALPIGALAGDLCAVKPEAESKKNPLPVKYRKLKAENEELKAKLQECKNEKDRLKFELSQLESQISSLEGERAQLQARLSSLPSKWELESQIRELENRLGR